MLRVSSALYICNSRGSDGGVDERSRMGDDAVNRKRIVYEISDVLDFVCLPCQESDDLQAWEGKNIMMKRHNRHNFCIQECLIGKKLKKLGDKLKEIEKEKRKGEQDGTKKIV